eukprot:scaffold20028_cov19-Tisochrysis_lutea.AAC.1
MHAHLNRLCSERNDREHAQSVDSLILVQAPDSESSPFVCSLTRSPSNIIQSQMRNLAVQLQRAQEEEEGW